MKLPFSGIIGAIIKPYLGKTRIFCHGGMFILSIPYTYFFSTLGIIISANHLRKSLGEIPIPVNNVSPAEQQKPTDLAMDSNIMLMHDLKIIATFMGLVQNACLLIGCITENPALFLPHLFGQLIVVFVKTLHSIMIVATLNKKNFRKLNQKVPAIMLIVFSWCQEFCVFRQFLCVCDL